MDRGGGRNNRMTICYADNTKKCDYRHISGPSSPIGSSERIGIKRCQRCAISRLYNMDEEEFPETFDITKCTHGSFKINK